MKNVSRRRVSLTPIAVTRPQLPDEISVRQETRLQPPAKS